MPKVPRISGKEAIIAFKKAGFEVERIKGSHHILKKPNHPFRLSIPCHAGKDVGIGLLKTQINSAGLTVEEFIELLNS